MTECCRAECTLYRVYVHYITARSLNRRDRRGDLRCKADRATREGETVEDCETGQTWRLASGESLTQHWLLLTHKASETGRLSVSGQVLPSRSHFIVECLLLPTALFASLSLSSVWSVAQTRNHWPWVPWGELKGSPRRPRFASTLSLINLHNAVTHTPRAPNTLLYFLYLLMHSLYHSLHFLYYLQRL